MIQLITSIVCTLVFLGVAAHTTDKHEQELLALTGVIFFAAFLVILTILENKK